MKKVLLVTHVSGFVPQFEMNNVRILQEMGYEVHYASNYKKPQYGNDNSRLEGTGIIKHQVDFARSPLRIIQNITAYRQLRALLEKEKFVLIHCHTPVGGAIARLAARKSFHTGLKVIYTVHGFHFFHGAPVKNWLLFYPIERFLAHFTDRLITINEEDYRNACNFKLRKWGEVKKINGVGIEVEKFEGIAGKRFRKNEIVFLSIGELNSNKNHKLVIESLHRIKRENYKYIICGQGKEKENLEKLIHKYNLENQVFLAGYKKDILEVLREADVFVMPSFREGLSVALQEAMAAGLPVIATNIRGNNELIDNGKGGWLIPSNDIDTMVNAMIEADRADLQKMSQYNLTKIKKYDKSKVSESMREIYSDILKEDI